MIDDLLVRLGDDWVLALFGGLVGLLFGASAQRSKFCMRAAVIELSERRMGERLLVWALAFAVAVAATQAALATGWLTIELIRQIAAEGSLSGAILGGLMFGVGMILSRGCASRLLILASTGNLRALVTGLVLTLVAQASLGGILSPLRERLAGLWTVPGGPMRDVTALFGLGHGSVALAGLVAALALVLWARRARIGAGQLTAAMLVGASVALGWVGTYAIASRSFEIVPVGSVTFTGPSADTLIGLVSSATFQPSFAVGLVLGVALGAFLMALATGAFRIERFGPETPMERYLIGAVLMGFGAMLAGGCAVGATVSGGAVMALTAWVAGLSMWAGALVGIAVLGDAAPAYAATKA